MKKLILIVIASMAFGNASTQVVGGWSSPVALTDSLSFNSHQNLVLGTTMLFYEKSQDTITPSDIYFNDIEWPMGEISVLSSNTIEYRNPQPLISDPYPNPKYFLIFESNENGNFDLYVMQFYDDNTFDTPYPLLLSPEDESSLSINTDASQYGHRATWLSNDSIYTASIVLINDSLQFADIEIIDSGNCANPLCSYDHIFWQKQIGNEAHIYMSVRESNVWGSPGLLYANGDNHNLSVSRSLYQYGLANFVGWDNESKILCYIYEYDFQALDTLNGENFNGVKQPSFFYYDILLKDMFFPALSFTEGEGSEQEIFFRDMGLIGSTEFFNISGNDVQDSYSELFQGPADSYSWWLYCIWQSQINGHVVLYGSKALVLIGDIDENVENNPVKIFPNPVKDEMQIRLKTEVPAHQIVSIGIFNNEGEKVDEIETLNRISNQDNIKWNRGDLPNGIYYLLIKTDTKNWSSKFILH